MKAYPPTYQFLFSIAAAIVLVHIPIIGKFFKVINTLIHESAHALTALLLNSEVVKIELFSNTSGLTLTKSNKKWKSFFIAFSAYPFSSLFAWFLYILALKEWYFVALLCLLIIVIINLTFFVRNIYGIFWLILYAAIIISILYFKNQLATTLFIYLSAGIVLVESIISEIILFKIAIKRPDKAGDASNLKNITHLPSMFWIIVFILLSAYIVWDIIIRFFAL